MFVATAGWSANATPRAEPIVQKSFSILAEAFPEAPVPGRGSTELGAKPLGSRVTVSNAPASAYGRAALSDNGTIELYTGPPPPGTISECDTTSTNLPRDAEVDVGGAHLSAHCADAPSATVSARGAVTAMGGSGSSEAGGDGATDNAIGHSAASVNDITIGPMHIASARYDATAHTDGTREGAGGDGAVSVSDATVAGIPVIIGPDGVAVDQDKVPTELVPSATSAIESALGQGGYLNVRTAQPEVTIADDGSTVTVRGGGVFFEGQSNDPTQPYFLRETLVGGSISVSVGADIAGAGPVASAPPSDGSTAPDQVVSPVRTAPDDIAPSPPDAIADVIAQRSVYRTDRYGIGWMWVIAAIVVAAIVGTLFRRRIEPWWNLLADRYLRG